MPKRSRRSSIGPGEKVNVVESENNRDDHAVASETLFLLGQLHLMVFGAPAINTPWNFATKA